MIQFPSHFWFPMLVNFNTPTLGSNTGILDVPRWSIAKPVAGAWRRMFCKKSRLKLPQKLPQNIRRLRRCFGWIVGGPWPPDYQGFESRDQFLTRKTSRATCWEPKTGGMTGCLGLLRFSCEFFSLELFQLVFCVSAAGLGSAEGQLRK